MVQDLRGRGMGFVFYPKCNAKPEKGVKQEKPISGWSVENNLMEGKKETERLS